MQVREQILGCATELRPTPPHVTQPTAIALRVLFDAKNLREEWFQV
jgi:hypothetical protein